MKVNLVKTKLMAMDSISGVMVKTTRVHGKITECVVKGN